MTDPEKETATEALIKVKPENYVASRTAGGTKSLHNDDAVAQGLEGLTLAALYEVAGKFLTFPLKVKGQTVDDAAAMGKAYTNLNSGMQRMNIGNRIRGQVSKIDAANEAAATKALADGKTPKVSKSGADKLAAILTPFIKARDKSIAEAAESKKAAAKAAAKAKEAAAKKAA